MSELTPLTRQQAAVLTVMTGVLCGEFSDFHEYVERIMGRPVFTHEMADEAFWLEAKRRARTDFLKIANTRGA